MRISGIQRMCRLYPTGKYFKEAADDRIKERRKGGQQRLNEKQYG